MFVALASQWHATDPYILWTFWNSTAGLPRRKGIFNFYYLKIAQNILFILWSSRTELYHSACITWGYEPFQKIFKQSLIFIKFVKFWYYE